MTQPDRKTLIAIRDYLRERVDQLNRNGCKSSAVVLVHEVGRVQDMLDELSSEQSHSLQSVQVTKNNNLENLERRVASLEWLIERQAKDIDLLRTTKRKRPANLSKPTEPSNPSGTAQAVR